MIRAVLATAMIVALTAPALAQHDSRHGWSWRSNDSGYSWERDSSPPGYIPAQPGDRGSSIYDTRPRVYPQEPSLGDTRPYRFTDPSRCTGLLCN